MGFRPKMPRFWRNRAVSVAFQPRIIGVFWSIGIQIVVPPILSVMFGYVSKMVVAIEENMPCAIGKQIEMELPDSVVPILCTRLPIHAGDEIFVSLLMCGRNMINARSIDLIIHTIDQPFLALPGAPLYYHHGFWQPVLIAFHPILGGPQDPVIATGSFTVVVHGGFESACQGGAPAHCQIFWVRSTP